MTSCAVSLWVLMSFEKMGAYGVAEQVQDRELATLGGAKRMGESIAE